MTGWQRKKRYLRIVLLFWGYLLDFFFEGVKRRLFGPGYVQVRRSRLLRRQAVRFRVTATELGGLLIKLGQFLSARVDLLPEEYVEELARLQDDVPAHDWGKISAQLTQELSGPVEDVFDDFSPEPVAAASLGQVHTARLKDGSQVAVKVLRPGIEELIRIDLEAIRRVLGLLRQFGDWDRSLNLTEVYQEFAETVGEELDYVQEGRNADRFRENFQSHHGIRIPRVHWQYSTRRVLTLEYVHGIKITDFAAIEAAGIDRGLLAQRLVQAYLKQILEDGFFHADPHPGNLFVQEDGTLIFVDFGMVGRITPPMMQRIRRLFIGIAERDLKGIAESLDELGFLVAGADHRYLRRQLGRFLNRFWGKTLEEIAQLDVSDLAHEVRELLFEGPFQVPVRYVFLGRAVGTLTGIATGLDPGLNVVEVFQPYARRLVLREDGGGVAADRLVQRALSLGGDLLSLPGLLAGTLRQLDADALPIRVNFDDLVDALDRQELTTRHLSIAVVFGSLLISSAVLLVAGFKALSALGFGLSGLAGLWSLRPPRRVRRPPRG